MKSSHGRGDGVRDGGEGHLFGAERTDVGMHSSSRPFRNTPRHVAPNPWALSSRRASASTARSRKASVPRPNTRRTTGVIWNATSTRGRRASARRRARDEGGWLSRRGSPQGNVRDGVPLGKELGAHVADGGAKRVGVGACECARTSGDAEGAVSANAARLERRRIRDTSSVGSAERCSGKTRRRFSSPFVVTVDGRRPGSSATALRLTAGGMGKSSRRALRRGGGRAMARARCAGRSFPRAVQAERSDHG